MLNFIKTTTKPAGFHGPRGNHPPRLPFFEGWYFKLVDAQAAARLAVIPGKSLYLAVPTIKSFAALDMLGKSRQFPF